jgi:hypothetical protein
MPTGFFDLPRELRDQIYGWLWASLTVDLPDAVGPRCMELQVHRHNLWANSGAPGMLREPAGLSATPAMLAETGEDFHGHGHMTLAFRCYGCQHIDSLQLDPNHILSPTTAHELHYYMNVMDIDRTAAPDKRPLRVLGHTNICNGL